MLLEERWVTQPCSHACYDHMPMGIAQLGSVITWSKLGSALFPWDWAPSWTEGSLFSCYAKLKNKYIFFKYDTIIWNWRCFRVTTWSRHSHDGLGCYTQILTTVEYNKFLKSYPNIPMKANCSTQTAVF